MKWKGHGLIILSLLILPKCLANEIPNCNYSDTVDLTNSHKFANGSYLYNGHMLIPPDQVGIYNYELQQGKKRVPLPDYVRGCACKMKNCVPFCCDPTKEMFNVDANECITNPNAGKYDPYVSVLFRNGTKQMQHVTKDLIVRRAATCKKYKSFHIFENNPGIWTIHPNGSFLYNYQNEAVVWNATFCLTPKQMDNDKGIMLIPAICIDTITTLLAKRQALLIAIAISIPFLMITLMVYLCITELQNLHGKCFISYVTSLTVAFASILFPQLLEVEFSKLFCQIYGYWTYFLLMCVFFWLNVISFDLWQSFRRNAPIRSMQIKRFLCYSAYGWGMPLCLSIIVIAIDNSNVDDSYKPGMKTSCFLDSTKWSAMVYFYGINLIIVLINIFFFATTMYKIVSMKRDIHKMMTKGGSKKNSKQQEDKYSFGLFLRLFLIMGIIWFFDIASYIESMLNPEANNWFFFAADIVNVLAGPFVFIFFILNRKVLALIKKRYNRFRAISDKSPMEEETTTQLTTELQQ